MNDNASSSPVIRLIFALVVAGISVAFSWMLTNGAFPPKPYVPAPVSEVDYDTDAFLASIKTDSMIETQRAIIDFGSRLPGQEGYAKTLNYVRSTMEASGFEVFSQPFKGVSPLLEHSVFSVLDDTGQAGATALKLYPFFPSFLQPVTTPEGGLTGELILINDETIASESSFEGKIGVLNAEDGHFPVSFGFNGLRYAQLGLAGLIVTHGKGLDAINWPLVMDRFNGMISSGPIPFPRMVADPEVLNYLSKQVNVDLVSRFRRVDAENLIAVLRAPNPSTSAQVISVDLDTHAALPDRAVGAVFAANLAASLELAQALAGHRDSLNRDIVFVFTTGAFNAQDGLDRLLRVLRINQNVIDSRTRASGAEESYRSRFILSEMEKHRTSRDRLATLLDLFNTEAFFVDAETSLRAVRGLDRANQALFEEQLRYIIQSVTFRYINPVLEARIELAKAPNARPTDPVFRKFAEVKSASDKASALVGYSLENILRNQQEFLINEDIRSDLLERFRELHAHHAFHFDAAVKELALAQLFDGYRDILVFSPLLFPSEVGGASPTSVAIMGRTESDATGQQVSTLYKSLAEQNLPGARLTVLEQGRETGRIISSTLEPAMDSRRGMWAGKGYASVDIFQVGRRASASNRMSPSVLPWMLNLESIELPLKALALTVLDIGSGTLNFVPVENSNFMIKDFGGRVVVEAVGQSLVPNYPLKDATIIARPREGSATLSTGGMYLYGGLEMTDPYGRWYREETVSDFQMRWRNGGPGANFVPAGYNERGEIEFIKNEGADGQRLFKSVNVPMSAAESLRDQTIVTFRAAPVAIVQLNNPQSMKDYSGAIPIDARGMTPFRQIVSFSNLGLEMSFIPPAERFYMLLQAGDPGNELVRRTRAFLLNLEGTAKPDLTREITGDGYLAVEQKIIQRVAERAGEALAFVNGQRLVLQNEFTMADARTNSNHASALAQLELAKDAALPQIERERLARESVIYSTLNHPVIRDSIYEAIVGILWYLFLLVPFVFFFEKLLFSFADVRRQVVAQTIIFLLVFGLLRVLHPAFQMVQSSLMILLGFIIIMISAGITILFSSKFGENLEELRKKQGKVAAADVNKLGVMASAFMLGLNNMNRRKVRTGLTCGTLTLLTFVMISFTSVQNNLVEEDIAIGRAAYQGMLIKREGFVPITNQEVFAFQQKFGGRYVVSPRRMLVGRSDSGFVNNPAVSLSKADATGVTREASASSIVMLDLNEPLRDALPLLEGSSWFSPSDYNDSSPVLPIIISEVLAQSLGLDFDLIGTDSALVQMNGVMTRIVGLFDGQRLGALTDLDRAGILPFDVESMSTVSTGTSGAGDYTVATDQDPKIPADQIILAPLRRLPVNIPYSREIISSIAISMPDAPFREAREVIESFMIQVGEPVFYGLDGNAFRGERSRKMRMSGLVDLIIPLLIAGMTVLNTMKGSVYERRSEIEVYNAVGIAPRYIFFMFIAEALVYAVVGSVIGYLASQGTGRILTELDLTGGLNMSYTSMATIYASWTIMAAVIISTYFPATQAMQIAAPAEESGWKLPEPEGNNLNFDLPFNFNEHERLAILEFFNRLLLERGEGSSGSFYSGIPQMRIAESFGNASEAVPELRTTIWLKPFDLAVSQEMILQTPFDPETKEFKARMVLVRLSGTGESWMRLNAKFVADLRKHFLHWRAVPSHDREEIYQEARARIAREMGQTVNA